MQINWLWGYFIPIGILLLAWGGLAPDKARRITPLAALALAVAVLSYWAVGYAFHLGGAYALNPTEPELQGLDRIWSPLDTAAGPGWGVIGLAGFFLTGDEMTPTTFSLFLAYLPLIATAVFLVVLAIADARRWLIIAAAGLAGGIVVPLAACWAWGGGWLAQLGNTLDLGHGFVDFGGSGVVLWVSSMMTAGILLFQERRVVDEPNVLPPAHFPLLANVGALLVGLGWAGWALSAPFHTYGATLDWNRAAVNVLLGMAGAVLTSQLYAWLVTGEFEPLMAARGMAGGWCALLASAPFLPSWAALLAGLFAGLLLPFLLYLVNEVLRLRDTSAATPMGLVGGLWGLLSVALLADGRWGQGWNNVDMLLEGTSMGVGAFWTAGGGGQLLAQAIGLIVLGLWGLIWGVLLGQLARLTTPRLSSGSTQEVAPSLGEAPVVVEMNSAALPDIVIEEATQDEESVDDSNDLLPVV